MYIFFVKPVFANNLSFSAIQHLSPKCLLNSQMADRPNIVEINLKWKKGIYLNIVFTPRMCKHHS